MVVKPNIGHIGYCVASIAGTLVLLYTMKVKSTSRKLLQNGRSVDELPGPPTHFMRGNLPDFAKTDPERIYAFMSFRDKYGGIFRIWTAPLLPIVRLTHPDTVKGLLRSDVHTGKTFGYKFLRPWLGLGLLTSSDMEKYKQRKALINPAFHFQNLKSYVPTVSRYVEVLLRKWTPAATAGEEVSALENFKLLALDIVCDAVMGIRCGAQSNPEHPYVKAVECLTNNQTLRVFRPHLWFDSLWYRTEAGRAGVRAVAASDEFTMKIISQRRAAIQANAGKAESFLDMLLTSSHDGKPFSDEDAREEVNTLVFAGHDTVSVALSWLMLELGQRPELQRRMQEELDAQLEPDQRCPRHEQLGKATLPLLEAVLKEGLRLHPSAPFVGRQLSSEEDLEIRIPATSSALVGSDPSVAACAAAARQRSRGAGEVDEGEGEGEVVYRLPADTNVVVDVLGVHTNPLVWGEDAMEFKPDRWISPSTELGKKAIKNPYAWIPFSSGMRKCTGSEFAKMEAKMILAAIVKNFTVECVNASEVTPALSIVLVPSPSPRIRLHPRA